MSDPNAPIDPFAAGREPEQPSSSDQPAQPSAGETPSSYGSQPSGYGAEPYGAQPPVPGAQPPAYGAQPPAYGAQPPAYGAQPPAYGAQPPYGAQTPYGAQAPAPYGGAYAGQPGYGYPKNSLGVWSLVLGIASFVLSCGFFTGIPAIILGNKAKRAVAEGQANNGGLATAGIVLGWIATVLFLLGLIFFFVVVATGDWEMVINDLNDLNDANLNT